MTDFHACEDCVWCIFNDDEILCINPLFNEHDIESRQSRCKYFIDEDDLIRIYKNLGIYDE